MTEKKMKIWPIIAGAVVIALAAIALIVFSGKDNKKDPESAALSTLREQLLSQEDKVIHLNEDISLSGQQLIVNGKKTLEGNGKLLVDGLTDDYIITIAENSELIIDGPTIDGNSAAKNGILVSEKAKLSFLDGELKNVTRLGIRVRGEAEVKGKITKTGTSWVTLNNTGKLLLDGAVLTDSNGTGIQVDKGAMLDIKGKSILTGAKAYIINNNGTATIEDAAMDTAGLFLISNSGTLAAKSTEICNAQNLGLVCNLPAAEMTLEKCNLHDSNGYLIDNLGKLTAKSLELANNEGYAVYNEGTAAQLDMDSVSLKNSKTTAFFNRVGCKMNLSNVAINDVSGYSLFNRGGDVAVKNITIKKIKSIIIMNEAVSTKEPVYGNMSIDGFTVPGAPKYSIISYGGNMTLKNGEVGVCGKSCIYIRDGKGKLENVTAKGNTSTEGLPVIQVGNSTHRTAVVTMDSVHISNGVRGIMNYGTLTFNSGSISNNRNKAPANSGGAINNNNVLVINGGTFENNTSIKTGGAICNQATLTINGGTFKGNTSGLSGAAISNMKGATVVVNNCKIAQNTAKSSGGAIYNAGSFTINGGTFESNTNGKFGGAVYNDGKFTMLGGTMKNNTSANQGGAVFNSSTGTAYISGGKISDNQSAKGGGALYNGGTMTVTGTVDISQNSAETGGGGICNGISTTGVRGNLLLSGGKIHDNTAGASGGAVYSAADMTITGGSLDNNTATNNGGAVYLDQTAVFEMQAGNITNNKAGKAGGAIYSMCAVNMSESKLSGNTAQSTGGAVHLASTAAGSFTNCSLSNNACGSDSKGADVFVYKCGLELNGGEYLSGEKENNIYNSEGTLTLGGKVSAGIFTDCLTIKDIFDPASDVSVELASVAVGTQVLSGNIAEGRTYIAFKNIPAELGINDEGCLYDPNAKIEAKLYNAAMEKIATGSFEEMFIRAEDGQTIELISDAEVTSTPLALEGKKLTVRDDGTVRTLKINNPTSRGFGLTKGAELTFIGTSQGGLTIEGTTGNTVGFHVNGNGTTNAGTALKMSGNVTVKNFKNTESGGQSNGAAIFGFNALIELDGTTFTGNAAGKGEGAAVSANGGTVKLNNVTMSGNTAGGVGQDINMMTNAGTVTIIDSSITSGKNVSGKYSVNLTTGTLTLGGKNTVDIKAEKLPIELTSDFEAASQVTLYLAGYAVGTEVVKDSTAEKDAAFTLPEAEANNVELSEGKLIAKAVVAVPDPEAEAWLYDAGGETPVAWGSFKDMVAAAADNQIIVLVNDATVNAEGTTQAILIEGKKLTVKDNGTAKILKINNTVGRGFGLTKGAQLTFIGTSQGGLTIEGTTSNSVGFHVNGNGPTNAGTALKMSGNVTVKNFKNTSTASGGLANGAAIFGFKALIELDGTTFTGNEAGKGEGAAVSANGGTVKLNNVTMSGNTASGVGQDINMMTNAGTVTIIDSSITSGKNVSGKYPVNLTTGTLTLGGRVTVDAKIVSKPVKFTSDFNADESDVTVD